MDKNKNENKKSYKKPLILGGIAVLLTLIGITGGNTYAKYVTSTNVPTQSATVAKWGYIIEANAKDLFVSDYKKAKADAVSMTKTSESSKLGISAFATSDDSARKLVVAPGSSGSAEIKVSGKAEVAAEFNLSIAVTGDVQYGSYAPIKWVLKENDTEINFTSKSYKVENLSVDAGTDISKTYTLSWEWVFESATDTAKNNAYDTILGYKAMGNSDADDAASKVSYIATGATEPISAYVENDYTNATTEITVVMSASIEQIAR